MQLIERTVHLAGEGAISCFVEEALERERHESVGHDQISTELLDGDRTGVDLAVVRRQGENQLIAPGDAGCEAEVAGNRDLHGLAVFCDLVSTRGRFRFRYVVGVVQTVIHVYLLGFAQSAGLTKYGWVELPISCLYYTLKWYFVKYTLTFNFSRIQKEIHKERLFQCYLLIYL